MFFFDNKIIQVLLLGEFVAEAQSVIEKAETYPLVQYDFEDLKLNFPKNIDGMLRNFYGDYMILPPVEKRKTHYPYILDFGDGVNRAEEKK